jgi:hypothetical protein
LIVIGFCARRRAGCGAVVLVVPASLFRVRVPLRGVEASGIAQQAEQRPATITSPDRRNDRSPD